MNEFTVKHTGYPVAGRAIRPDEWTVLSTHETESAAWKRIAKETAHLDSGQWDDHYRVIAPDGTICDRNEYAARSEAARALGRKGGSRTSDAKTASSRANGKRGGRPRKAE